LSEAHCETAEFSHPFAKNAKGWGNVAKGLGNFAVLPARLLLLPAFLIALIVSGCSHRTQSSLPSQSLPPAARNAPSSRIPRTPVPRGGVTAEDLDFVSSHKPIYTQVGYATWYTAPYKGRRSANGDVFDDRSMTAANRTLPMGSLVLVTNLQTGQSAAMRITDRGPFVEDRILDLTEASAKATGVYRAGLAKVRLDVYRTPKPIDTGGRWCVQIGALHSEHAANKLKKQLEKKYSGSSVIDFPGQDSYWVRIRPEGDNREQAEYIASHVHPKQGEAYLTRLD
jgi:rare lipoprotein A